MTKRSGELTIGIILALGLSLSLIISAIRVGTKTHIKVANIEATRQTVLARTEVPDLTISTNGDVTLHGYATDAGAAAMQDMIKSQPTPGATP